MIIISLSDERFLARAHPDQRLDVLGAVSWGFGKYSGTPMRTVLQNDPAYFISMVISIRDEMKRRDEKWLRQSPAIQGNKRMLLEYAESWVKQKENVSILHAYIANTILRTKICS